MTAGAVEGRVLPGHPLVGQPDPLANQSRNPITFDTVRTLAPVPGAPRPAADVLADAIKVMSEAARLRRPRARRTAAGGWEPDPERTEQADWAEFVTHALAGAAANMGGIELALAGRRGSWETDGVRQLLHSTVGVDEQHLWAHRTEPLTMTLYVDELLADRCDINLQYDKPTDELERRAEQAFAAAATLRHRGLRVAIRPQRRRRLGTAQPAAPAWSWDSWRQYALTSGSDPARRGPRAIPARGPRNKRHPPDRGHPQERRSSRRDQPTPADRRPDPRHLRGATRPPRTATPPKMDRLRRRTQSQRRTCRGRDHRPHSRRHRHLPPRPSRQPGRCVGPGTTVAGARRRRNPNTG
jgi:hypothetical protein